MRITSPLKTCEQRFGSYTLSKGGIDNLLRQGRRVSPSIQGLIDFDNTNAFFFEIKPSQSNKGYIEKTGDFFNNCHKPEKDYSQWNRTIWDSAVEESSLKDNKRWRAAYLRKYLGSFTVYHFHDTSATSPMRGIPVPLLPCVGIVRLTTTNICVITAPTLPLTCIH